MRFGIAREMDTQASITQWIEGARQGDGGAGQRLWEKYYRRLIGMARVKLGDGAKRVADEDDVAVDAFNSFLKGAEAGRFPRLSDRDDLWQVLVMLTARKAIDQGRRWARQKRGGGQVRGESYFQSDDPDAARGIDLVVGTEPDEAFAASVADEFRFRLEQLGDETLRRVAIMKMEGHGTEEIAGQLGVKDRTIRRKLEAIREIWGPDPETLEC